MTFFSKFSFGTFFLRYPVHRIWDPVHRIRDPVHRIRDPVHRIRDPVHRIWDPVHRIWDPVHRIRDPVHRIWDPVHRIWDPMHRIRDPMHRIRDPMHRIRDPVHRMHSKLWTNFSVEWPRWHRRTKWIKFDGFFCQISFWFCAMLWNGNKIRSEMKTNDEIIFFQWTRVVRVEQKGFMSMACTFLLPEFVALHGSLDCPANAYRNVHKYRPKYAMQIISKDKMIMPNREKLLRASPPRRRKRAPHKKIIHASGDLRQYGHKSGIFGSALRQFV